ncbi:MAG TPA: HNH endonuclease [Terriglobia bacterium]|nr:HNH endonuclease [Terriglobia bacterium]
MTNEIVNPPERIYKTTEKHRADQKEWYRLHREEALAWSKRFRDEHSEELKAYRNRPEVKEKKRENSKRYAAKRVPGEQARYAREWRAKQAAKRPKRPPFDPVAYRKKYYQEHREKIAEYSKIAYQKFINDPERRARKAAKLREKRRNNPEYQRALRAKSMSKPEVRARAYVLQNKWKKEHKDMVLAQVNRRRTREYTASGSFTVLEWKALCAFFKHRCAMCRRKRKLTVDHIIPLSKGGSSFISNIQPLCQSCNSMKHNKIMLPTITGPLFHIGEQTSVPLFTF